MSAEPPMQTYALTFRLYAKRLENLLGPNWKNAWRTVETMLAKKGFTRKTKQGKLYVGRPGTTATDCLNAILFLTKKLKWFSESVKNIQMVRVCEPVDVTEIVKKAAL